jgi:hypothetical protein
MFIRQQVVKFAANTQRHRDNRKPGQADEVKASQVTILLDLG